ncbi:MAG: hypothetical protein M1347_05755 [Chloroflexi bacterium]|nr:hypothetical protein [Chloroflexota bacterium]
MTNYTPNPSLRGGRPAPPLAALPERSNLPAGFQAMQEIASRRHAASGVLLARNDGVGVASSGLLRKATPRNGGKQAFLGSQ